MLDPARTRLTPDRSPGFADTLLKCWNKRDRQAYENVGDPSAFMNVHDIDEVFGDYWQWIEDTVTTEETPWLKVVCAMVGAGSDVEGEATDLADGPIADGPIA